MNAATNSGAAAQQFTDNGTPDHDWTFTYTGAGYYKLVNKGIGLLADVTGASQSDGALVDQWVDNGGANQHWQMR